MRSQNRHGYLPAVLLGLVCSGHAGATIGFDRGTSAYIHQEMEDAKRCLAGDEQVSCRRRTPLCKEFSTDPIHYYFLVSGEKHDFYCKSKVELTPELVAERRLQIEIQVQDLKKEYDRLRAEETAERQRGNNYFPGTRGYIHQKERHRNEVKDLVVRITGAMAAMGLGGVLIWRIRKKQREV